MSAYTLGMDVSFYQESMDWARAFQHGIRFAFIKATERTSTIDRRFESNWSNAGKAGILKGAYHFYRSQYSARQQAAFFHQVVSRSGDLGDLPAHHLHRDLHMERSGYHQLGAELFAVDS